MTCVICGGEAGEYGIGRCDWEMQHEADLCTPCAYRLVPGLEERDRLSAEAAALRREEWKQHTSPEAIAERAARIQKAQDNFNRKLERERRADARAVAKFDKGIV